MRSQGEPVTGTPFAAFTAFPPAPDRGSPQAALFEQPDRPERPERPDPHDRAAAFYAGTRRGRSAGYTRRGSPPRRTDHGQIFTRPPEH